MLYDQNEIIVIVGMPCSEYASFDVYVKGTKETSAKYTKYRFNYNYVPFDKNSGVNSDSNSSLYRIKTAYIAERTGEFEFQQGLQVMHQGENEMALMEAPSVHNGYVKPEDYIGGFHGDENLTEVFLELDGKRVSLKESGEYKCETVRFYQKSLIDRWNIKDSAIITHTKDYTITKDGIHLHQTALWNVPASLKAAYMTLFTIMRQPTEEMDRVTDFADFYWSDGSLAAHYDVSNYGKKSYIRTEGNCIAGEAFAEYSYIPEELLSKSDGRYINRVRLWSDNIEAEVATETVQGLKNSFAHLEVRVCGDNKVYFGSHKDMEVSVGELWEVNNYYCVKVND